MSTLRHILPKSLDSGRVDAMLCNSKHAITRSVDIFEGPGAHPASYPMGTGGYFPGGKSARA